ncbi:MAG TPA: hypothetical protein VG519_04245 [Pseudochrobactrum sp.]|nr:hypothetical protein [Pseudochrobactrum sp.]
MKNQEITRDQWIAKIAKKSGQNEDQVERVLARHKIEPRLTRPIPRRLLIESLSFNGEKSGDFQNKLISFSRSDLTPGLYAMVSEVNLKGKTSLLRIIRWLLTGVYNLPQDMAGWLHTARLGFRIDDQKYEVALSNVAESKGTLTSFARGRSRAIAEFADAETFHSVMDKFFLTELNLEALTVVAEKNESGIEQRHGWNWLATAMIIDPAPNVLFGTDTSHGKAIRMMQMYLGIPWVLTRADMMAAKKRIDLEANQMGKTNRELVLSTEKRLAELRTFREELEGKLKGEKSIADLRRNSADALNEYMQAASNIRKLAPIVNLANEEQSAAEDAVNRAVRELQQFKENQAAGRIFRKLRPVCCPSCEEVYSEEYREEKESKHDCMVCGREERKNSDPSEGTEEVLVAAVEDAKAEQINRRKHFESVKQAMEAAVTKRDAEDARNQGLEKEIEKAQTDSGLAIEAVRYDAQIAELERLVKERTDPVNVESEILRHAIAATEKLYEEDQAEVLEKVSSLMTGFAQSFGMTDLKCVTLKGNTNLDVSMTGGDKTFSKCEPGERMRLKVAATLALIQVSEERGIGTHPGVLFVDSIANNELIDKDVAAIVRGLHRLSETLPDVQVFISGISSPAILDHISCDNVFKNRADGYLW